MPMDLWDLFRTNGISRFDEEERLQKDLVRSEAREEASKFQARLERKINMLTLINRGLWEMLEERLDVSMDELVQKVQEIDLRDGVADGRLNRKADDCPKCDAKINRDFNRCLFCGYVPQDQDVFDKLSG